MRHVVDRISLFVCPHLSGHDDHDPQKNAEYPQRDHDFQQCVAALAHHHRPDPPVSARMIDSFASRCAVFQRMMNVTFFTSARGLSTLTNVVNGASGARIAVSDLNAGFGASRLAKATL